MNQKLVLRFFLFETTYSPSLSLSLVSILDPAVEQPSDKMRNYQNHQLELLDRICISCFLMKYLYKLLSIALDEF
jgi:hypothetical protein